MLSIVDIFGCAKVLVFLACFEFSDTELFLEIEACGNETS